MATLSYVYVRLVAAVPALLLQENLREKESFGFFSSRLIGAV